MVVKKDKVFLNVEISKSLKDDLKIMAIRRTCSLQDLVIILLSEGVKK